MIFPQRITEIANMIPEQSHVADIGADHGLLELYLLTRKNNVFVLAIENKKGPYEILRENLIAFSQIRLSLSDGLTAVDPSIDTIVLAGMGGYNICSILSRYPKKVRQAKRIIVDPHKDIDVVRKTIVDYGFDIELEKIVLENGKYYNLISFIRNDNHKTYSYLELKYGYKIAEDPLWEDYKKYRLDHIDNLLKMLRKIEGQERYVNELETIVKELTNYGKN